MDFLCGKGWVLFDSMGRGFETRGLGGLGIGNLRAWNDG